MGQRRFVTDQSFRSIKNKSFRNWKSNNAVNKDVRRIICYLFEFLHTHVGVKLYLSSLCGELVWLRSESKRMTGFLPANMTVLILFFLRTICSDSLHYV